MEIQKNMIDILNYYLSGGSLVRILGEAGEEAECTLKEINLEAAKAYRQSIGGVITEGQQLFQVPGFSPRLLGHLTEALGRLDSDKLTVLAPQTTWNNQVDPYVNGPACLGMIIEEIKKAQHYIHLSVMLFFNDRSGNLVADELFHALKRG